MSAPKGLRAEIVTSRFHSPNGGISSRVQQVTVVGSDIDEISEATEAAPAVRLVHRMIGGEVVVHAEPIDQPEGLVGPMASGAYIAFSDSRLRRAVGFYGAVSLHDRFETQADYDSLSR